MRTANEGTELTRVGSGTPMGELMRCYWIPAAMSSELVRDGAPMRLMLLGEKLIAFRDSDGRVGVMDHRCPHRCASLFLGRNEEGGIRCVYHGWKFDRVAQQNNTIYTGIDGIHLQDQAITESMGPIVDHSFEHLAPCDQMITRTRRRLLMAARGLRDNGVLPPGVEDADLYREARSGYFVSNDNSPWREVYSKQLAASVRA